MPGGQSNGQGKSAKQWPPVRAFPLPVQLRDRVLIKVDLWSEEHSPPPPIAMLAKQLLMFRTEFFEAESFVF